LISSERVGSAAILHDIKKITPQLHGQVEVEKIQPKTEDPYPLMVWNFIETIIDKCEKDPSGELMETWAPIISAEAKKFGWWIEERDAQGHLTHSDHFKNDFMMLAQALVPASKEPLSAGEDLNGPAFLRLYRALKMIKDAPEVADNEKYKWINREFIDKGKISLIKGKAEFLQLFETLHKNKNLRKGACKNWDVPPHKIYDENETTKFYNNRCKDFTRLVLKEMQEMKKAAEKARSQDGHSELWPSSA